MKIRYTVLLLAILLSASFVGFKGHQLKKEVIEPLQLEEYSEKSIFELPFLAYTDDELMFFIEFADELLSEMTEPTEPEGPSDVTDPSFDDLPASSEPDTQPSTTPSEPTVTEPSATEPSQTVPPETEPSTKPTEPSVPDSKPADTEPNETKPTEPKDEPNLNFPEGRVDDSWFENTLFIGDSRLLGLALYARSGNAHYFCVASANCSTIFKQTLSDKDNFSNKTLEQLLSEHQYDKIIVNFGINDAGYGDSWFTKRFEQFMDKIRTWNPDAKIILNAVMPVTKRYIEKSAYGGAHWEPENLRKISAHMASYANGTDVFFIDCNEYFADANGYLHKSLTGDGCHPTAKHYKTWREWMSWALSTLGI